MSSFKIQGGTKAPFLPSPFDTHSCVYSIVNAGEFMSWLRVEVGDNEIQTCMEPLAITNRK